MVEVEQMSFKYSCENCKRTTEKENKKVLVVCGCGYEMDLIKYFTPKGSLKTELKGGFKKWNI